MTRVKAAQALLRLEREIGQMEELLAVVREELRVAVGTERREVALELHRRANRLSALRSRRWDLQKRLRPKCSTALQEPTPTQLIEDQAEQLVAALLGLPAKQIRTMLAEVEEEQERERLYVERERYKEVCAEYVCESTDRMAKFGRWR